MGSFEELFFILIEQFRLLLIKFFLGKDPALSQRVEFFEFVRDHERAGGWVSRLLCHRGRIARMYLDPSG